MSQLDTARVIVMVMTVGIAAIRVAHSVRGTRVTTFRLTTTQDKLALVLTIAGFVLPILWAARHRMAEWDFTPNSALIAGGAAIQAASLYLFHHTHVDLGANWSSRVQLFDRHQLITSGVYSRIRHPMYLALMLFGLGQALVAPNWIAAPACLVGTTLLYLLRVAPEEQMMRLQFGSDYEAYAARTGRLMPRVRRPAG